MVKYFIGNVLSPTNTQPEQHDPTFAFTKKEAFDLDLTGKPIRMEHHPENSDVIIQFKCNKYTKTKKRKNKHKI